MKIQVISEDFPKGRVMDWPAVPREGDFVCFEGRGGETNQRVISIRWIADLQGVLESVEIHLEY